MAIYVDSLREHRNGSWCHMATDSDDLTELHEMADRIGLRREWFQDHPFVPHYDLRPSKRELAVKNGAAGVGQLELAKRCRRD